MSAVDVAKDIENALRAVNRDAEIEKLKACLMVLDATIHMLVPGLKPEWLEMFKSQIAAAKEAYEHGTGEESMIGFVRNRDSYRPMLVPVGLGQNGKMHIADWPWCEACHSYHHPENKSCKRKEQT